MFQSPKCKDSARNGAGQLLSWQKLACFVFVFFVGPIAFISKIHHAQAGEWETSGAPTLPYQPKGKLTLHCTLKISLSRGLESLILQKPLVIKTEDFQFGHYYSHRTKKTDNWSTYSYPPRVADTSMIPEWANDQEFSISFRQDPSDQVDIVILSLRATTQRNSIESYSFNQLEFRRDQNPMQVQANLGWHDLQNRESSAYLEFLASCKLAPHTVDGI